MSRSWSSSTVSIRTIPKPAPKLVLESIWPDAGGNSFYIWGGHSNQGEENDLLTTESVWRFVADGEGGGSWGTEIPKNRDVYEKFHLSEGGAYTTAHNTGFNIGGMASGWTQKYRADTQPISGVASYNFTRGTWSNDSASDVSAFGTLVGGTAEFVPGFGDNGVILVLGGASYPLLAGDQPPGAQRDFRNITLFDPITKVWYWQLTTGSAPTPRQRFCSVGAESTDGTHEIFVFGGTDETNSVTFDDVYILSLPGFVWSKADTSEGGKRSSHSCVVVGKRQMLSVGGTNDKISGQGQNIWLDPDPFPQGLGIFDMTELSWSTDYSSDAAAYDSPKVVKDWYKNTGVKSVQWSNGETEQLFMTEGGNTRSGASDQEKPVESKKPIGPIVGGTVGGVALLAIIGAVVFFVRRRKQPVHHPVATYDPESLDKIQQAGHDTFAPKPVEIGTQEVGRQPVTELPTEQTGGGAVYHAELDGGDIVPHGRR
ncbi:uncharacterized protein DNG_03155 [Cephalotrichum gorgonifer]|uniref:Kelch repeat protein n=1 Tax=Cephalotrichum gorgonifer TaxID=2041049 RepID=A0AAE8MUR9_9PEZI|nr:uncharacterized protein DNG_03155 [Cephalotrichum gorgonifer]